MVLRTKKTETEKINSYNFDIAFLRSEETMKLVERYSDLIEIIIKKKKQKLDIINETKELDEIKEIIKKSQSDDSKEKNILKWSYSSDKKIWKWKDSAVYEFENNSRYIYKEWKESVVTNIEYLRKKYLILKAYLGNSIPKSYFILWESFSQLRDRWLRWNKFIETKSITIQTKISWKDVSQMNLEEKTHYKFLIELEKSHKKYVLLKLFLQTLLEELELSKKSMDLQLDLWLLSNIDTFHYDQVDFVDWKLKSPNIMWDEEKISFIDFWFWEWDSDKEKVFNKMMHEETFEKWKQLLNIYWIQ